METTATMKSTKKEMLDIINSLKKELNNKEAAVLNPEKIKQDKENNEIHAKADKLLKSELSTLILNLKTAVNKELTLISEKIEAESDNYQTLIKAIELKNKELKDIYGLESEMANLALTIQAQAKAKEEFNVEMNTKRKALADEITEAKLRWEKEKKETLETIKENNLKLEKERKREVEEYEYKLKRDREVQLNKLNDEKISLQKELTSKKEEFEKQYKTKAEELEHREETIVQREKKMDELQNAVNFFPKQLEETVLAAKQELEKQLKADFDKNEALLNKTYEGEKNVFLARMSAMETLVKDQAKQIDILQKQQEKAYEKVQDIASKAVAGAAEKLNNLTVKMAKNDHD